MTIPKKKGLCNRNAKAEKPKVILDHVSGSIQPGQFLAIIGASGKSNTHKHSFDRIAIIFHCQLFLISKTILCRHLNYIKIDVAICTEIVLKLYVLIGKIVDYYEYIVNK